MIMNAVETQNLSKSYGDERALDSVNFIVPEGSVYVLVGANGAGKSTTFKILLNLERASSGSASVFGLDTAADGPRARAQIGYVPEHQESPYPAMTCGALLQHVAAYYPCWDSKSSAHLIDTLGIRTDKKSGSLSKGELRRLQLVLAMAHRPPLLLLDEPTEGLDPLARRQVLSLVAEHLADSPTTVVIATHHVHEVDNLTDHVGILKRGKLAVQMQRDDLRQHVAAQRAEDARPLSFEDAVVAVLAEVNKR
jgi:ABC-2 type transport system ATP-binding protein